MSPSSAIHESDPLRPIDAVLRLAGLLMIGYAVYRVGLPFLVGHGHLGVWGFSDGCFDAPRAGLPASQAPVEATLAPGLTVGATDQVRLCPQSMSWLDGALVSLPGLLWFGWAAGFLLLIHRAIGRARRTGLFTSPLADELERLGRWVLAGWTLLTVLVAAMKSLAVHHVVPGHDLARGFVAQLDWSWPIVIGGFGLLTIGRILRQTVPMREELEATV
ncbi:hypothetical protein [Luteococcus peritonei]|uniref:DUF2975 domain-containing protein n=1 Tax=Luteococcus peritonei TaxID=88874 RepID=A0ABW4RS56_9ACTN